MSGHPDRRPSPRRPLMSRGPLRGRCAGASRSSSSDFKCGISLVIEYPSDVGSGGGASTGGSAKCRAVKLSVERNTYSTSTTTLRMKAPWKRSEAKRAPRAPRILRWSLRFHH
ncbi:developmentally regulated protein, putative [Leishmania tarentolae]|uniref:Developmentally regulated protein, putative n=1 Tax=Leishmania tarentolae TaxID=5689 RepID=A0A640KDY9_LEITA|nr:developmentally regulated protein, putative [Leishmania tarentolae]GET87298.1 developmentally regulated protein, putative [Leishmania tarentolae]